jgi:hypothetical protein
MKTRTEFFAVPPEQKDWLISLLSADGVWCAAWRPGKQDPIYPVSRNALQDYEFSGAHRDELMFFFGRHDLVPSPIWRKVGSGQTRLDLIRSQAVQFVASIVASDRILLDGQLAIMRKEYYDDVGIDSRGLREWFRTLCMSLASLHVPKAVLVQRTTKGALKKHPNIIVTAGAFEWWRKGGLLKEFVDGPVTFDIHVGQEQMSVKEKKGE